MPDIKIDISNIFDFVPETEINSLQEKINASFQKTINKTAKGNDFLGWVDLPKKTNFNLIKDIETEAKRIQKIADVFVVIGIGGSYLGGRAVIEALSHNFKNILDDKKSPKIIYAGNNISEDYLADLLDILDKKDYALTVISKSGTTTEPAMAFRILKKHLEKKYGKKNANERIIAITDREKGALKKLALKENYKTYIIADDIGGRYSVLTPVGLLPIAVAGFDIQKLFDGAKKMREISMASPDINLNPAAKYAAARNALYNKGKIIEIMVNYQPNLKYFTEWWKQLYGESEGKENKGIFPAGVSFTTDLHSMGQYIQQGIRNIFETVVSVEKTHRTLKIPLDDDNLDGLNYIADKNIDYVNKMAELGTKLAHLKGGVPNISISIPEINEYYLGQLIYFYEFACAISGYTLGINPFDQPGVEAYKKNMFALLGKPGFEKKSEDLKKSIK